MDVGGYLLAEGERMIRANGFEAFTLARLSDRIGMRVSSIQGHFRTREDLCNAVVDAYLSKLTAALDDIAKRCIPSVAKLSAFSQIFRDPANGQMPLHNAIEREKLRTVAMQVTAHWN
ncbi:MAG: helix-turn-helix transcriptional regulator [Proteobacteria bacterium]|nr:helix-turn-helix transcriptional regulator [Pseudomonadota bacterium]